MLMLHRSHPRQPMSSIAFVRSAAATGLLLSWPGSIVAQQWQRVPLPLARQGHALAYDLARGRTVSFGGYDAFTNTLLSDTFEYAGTQWSRIPTAISPPARSGHGLAYDSARGRTVLFGGSSSTGYLGDTWEYDGAHWSSISTAASPSPRYSFAFAYDNTRGRTVLFCGSGSTGYLGDTWEYDGANWTPVTTPFSLTARTSPGFAWDLARHRGVLFGGYTGGSALAETWEYAGTNWTRVTTATTPPPSSGNTLVYDATRQRTVLLVGSVTNGLDTWEYDGSNWSRIVISPQPPVRGSLAIAFDVLRSRTVLFGGTGVFNAFSFGYADTWEYDGASWTEIATASSPPGLPPVSVYDSRRARTVMLTIATFEFDGALWRMVNTAASPGPRNAPAVAFDSRRGRTVLFGGADVHTTWGDTWEYDGVDWTHVQARGQPLPRYAHSLAYDATRGRTVLFGGIARLPTGDLYLSDTCEYDGAAWSNVTTATSPLPRYMHALAYDAARGRTVLFGGRTNSANLGDTWEYDGVDWHAISPATSPPAMSFPALCYDAVRGRIVEFGGQLNPTTWSSDVWEYDGSTWTRPAIASPPSARMGAGLVYDLARNREVMFGGSVTYPSSISWNSADDTWELLPAPVASWTRHGRGCTGSAGTPSLDAAPGALPTLGTSFPLRLSSLPAQPGLALLALGFDLAQWNGIGLPLDLTSLGLPSCLLWIAADGNVALAHPGGSTTYSLAIPAIPSLAGLVVGTQAFVFDAAAPGGIGSATNAGVLRLQ
jgi:hypothetical protein